MILLVEGARRLANPDHIAAIQSHLDACMAWWTAPGRAYVPPHREVAVIYGSHNGTGAVAGLWAEQNRYRRFQVEDPTSRPGQSRNDGLLALANALHQASPWADPGGEPPLVVIFPWRDTNVCRRLGDQARERGWNVDGYDWGQQTYGARWPAGQINRRRPELHFSIGREE